MTLRGPFMASRKLALRDDPNIWLRCSANVKKTLILPMKNARLTTTPSLSLPCVRPKRPRVHVQNGPVYAGHILRTCFSACAPGAGIHGDVLNGHTGTCGRTHGDVLDGQTGFVSVSHTTHTTHRLRQVAPFVLVTFFCAFMMSTNSGVDTATAAARRRQRRLRSWRMTVAMTLAEMTHHTAPRGPKMARVGEGVEHEQHDGLRAQKPPLPWVRPGSLFDPGPQRSDRTVRYSAEDTPLQVVPALPRDDGVDGTTLRFLLEQNLLLKKKQEEEEKAKKVAKSEVQQQAAAALEQARLLFERNKRRKRKKRRKKRTPRTSSLPGRARRRLRQWSACSAGFTGDDIPRVMFPSGVARPKMLCIMAGLVQMDSYSGMARLYCW